MGQAWVMEEESPEVTDGFLLGGRVRYAQPRVGYRTGIEPVLLAASVTAWPGDRVLEAGCGAGAGLLCLAARVPGIAGVGVELDPAMAALARRNFTDNGFDSLSLREADVMTLSGAAEFDHVFANPPWHEEFSSASQLAGRDRAKRARAGLLEGWIHRLLELLRPGGTIRLALPADQFARAGAALAEGGAGGISLFPLWPREAAAAKLVLIGAVKGRGMAARVLPGLVLHEGAGFTVEAERVLRGGAGLDWT